MEGNPPSRMRSPSTSAGLADVDAMSCHIAHSWGRDFDVCFMFGFFRF
ncbi:hypothetical protein Goshw_001929 [Gossypium schwendimanii]|uniref:Uncharacterized protein n=1 Tax=Gossypium schwendimanii TaxID=34291 RepID=A0A7J9LT13_GOSSC|nr:hypothetical protein [Gossypium schwendimanii]